MLEGAEAYAWRGDAINAQQLRVETVGFPFMIDCVLATLTTREWRARRGWWWTRFDVEGDWSGKLRSRSEFDEAMQEARERLDGTAETAPLVN